MITKLKLAHSAVSAQGQSPRHGACRHVASSQAGAERREPKTVQAYVFLLLWVVGVLSAVDGLAAVAFHVG
jgi:hypothetical protein